MTLAALALVSADVIHAQGQQAALEPVLTPAERVTMKSVLEHIESGRADDAIALLEQMRGGAASAAFDFTLGNLQLSAGKLDEAATAYQAAVAKHASYRKAWANLGMVRFRLGQHDSAAQALNQAVVRPGLAVGRV